MKRWIPDPPDLGAFSFRRFDSPQGGAAHDPARRGHIAFLRADQPLPDGWKWGHPPPMAPEEWAAWAREAHA